MVTQHRVTGRAASLPSGLAAGAAVSMVVTILVCSLGAWLISSEILAQEYIGYCAIGALLMASILGGMTAMKRTKRKRLPVSLMNGGIYYFMLIALTILFFDGSFRGMGVTLAVVLIGSLIAVLPADGHKKRNLGQRHKKIRR